MRGKYVSPPFEKDVKGGQFNCFNFNYYLATYRCKGLRFRIIMAFKNSVHDIPGQNGVLSTFTSGVTLTGSNIG